ncbi:MAG: aryl-sulfate sulfotransferase [Chitinophagales bacterium]|nr:aryl-sulfate sulfotransferase [Chitinophagales bacterium]
MRIFTAVLCFTTFLRLPATYAQFQYINPKPNSTHHNINTNIILRNGSVVDKNSLDEKYVFIQGTISGSHSSRIILSDNDKTILVYPTSPFAEGETVDIIVSDGFRKKDGEIIQGTSFSFQTHPHYTPSDLQSIKDALRACSEIDEMAVAPSNNGGVREQCFLPDHDIYSSGTEWDGDIFYYNFRQNDPLCYARTIIDNQGDSIYAQFNNNQGVDFKINHNGYLTYYNDLDSSFMMADSTYEVVKEFFMGNGYFPDNHEFLIFPNGNRFMFCYDVHPNVDLTQYGGMDSATVIGLVIQELDSSNYVIFEWSSWDHFEIDDMVNWQSISGSQVDYVHGNSMELDFDGNLLLSSRHLSEITKIDLSTGDIIWRMGGENNQFVFINDIDSPVHFSAQHDFRRLANGHYTMFNNANQMQVQASTVKEYVLDQEAKTATLVWYYKHPQVNGHYVISNAMGSAQRLPNGNTFINYGLVLDVSQPFPRFTEVDSVGNIVWEFRFTEDSSNYFSYRAFKFKWDRCAPPVDTSLILTSIGTDTAYLSWGLLNYASNYIFQYKLNSDSDWISIAVSENSISLADLQPESIYQWRVQSICTIFNDTSKYSDVQEFTTLSTELGSIIDPSASLKLYPNPANEYAIFSFDIVESDWVTVTLINVLGEIIVEKLWKALPGKNEQTMSLTSVPPGIYVFHVRSKLWSGRQLLKIQ